MRSVPHLFNQAITLHRQGKLHDAELLYRQILQLDPRHAESLHLLGLLAIQVGRCDLAVEPIQQALRIRPTLPEAHSDLGNALKLLGKLDEAIAHYRESLRLMPDNLVAHNNLGMILHQQGNLEAALGHFKQVVRLRPDLAEGYNNLGNARRDLGQIDEGITDLREAVRLKPGFPEAHCNLGNALRDKGKLDEAIRCYHEAARLRPDYPEAFANLGNTLGTQRKLDEAIASFRQALRLRPEYAAAHNSLGIGLMNQGKLDEAIYHYQQAQRCQPNFAQAYLNLGVILQRQGKLDEAIDQYRRAVHHQPDYAEGYNNLGTALQERGRFDESIANYRQALRFKPGYAEACTNLGTVFYDQAKFDEAIAIYREALLLKPEHTDAYHNLGTALQEQGKLHEAIACYNTALAINADLPKVLCSIGTARERLGDFAGAESIYREVLAVHPHHVDALWLLAGQLRGKLPAADRAVIEQCLVESELNDSDRSRLLFGLASVCDAHGEFEQAADYLRQANALAQILACRKGQDYPADDNARFTDRIIAEFTPAFFERVRGFGLETERPVFVVGLPRSGTTLTEQILAAHSQVFGAGELSIGREDFLLLGAQPTEADGFAALLGLQANTVRRVAQRHLDQLSTLHPTAERVVDKMPDNYQYLGLLAVLFPKAKFIHCRRDLRDVAVSCWMTFFRNLQWANHPEHIAARFRDYQRLMQHWRKVLPVPMLEIDYEETVTDLPTVARRLVDWCGLEWEPACLNYHKSDRPILTASASQARLPVYARSVGRWRNYERYLREVLKYEKAIAEAKQAAQKDLAFLELDGEVANDKLARAKPPK